MHQNYLLFALKANVGGLMHEEYVGTIGVRRMEVFVCKKQTSAHGQYVLWVTDPEDLSQTLYLNKLITIKRDSEY